MKLVEAILSEKIEVTERWGVSHVWLRDSMSKRELAVYDWRHILTDV